MILIITFIGGGLVGVLFMCLVHIENYEPQTELIYSDDCQICKHYFCTNDKDCKGNPTICEWSVKK